MTIRKTVTPDWIRAETLKIFKEIEITEGSIEMGRIRAIADGFGVGLGSIAVLSPEDLDDLKIRLNQAIDRRIEAGANEPSTTRRP